jgi:RNase adaptor protein for sRNA GlmZ degradation
LQELRNASRAATRERHWSEYQLASNAIVKLLDREAAKGARVLRFKVHRRKHPTILHNLLVCNPPECNA